MSNLLSSGSKNIINALADRFGSHFRGTRDVSFAISTNYADPGYVYPASQRDTYPGIPVLSYSSFNGQDPSVQLTVGYWQIYFDTSEGANPFTSDTGVDLGNSYHAFPSGCVVTGATAEADLSPVTDMRLFWTNFDDITAIIPYDGKCYFGSLTVPHSGIGASDTASLTYALLIKKDGTFDVMGDLPLGTTDNLFFSHILRDNNDGVYQFVGQELTFTAENVPTSFTPVTFEV